MGDLEGLIKLLPVGGQFVVIVGSLQPDGVNVLELRLHLKLVLQDSLVVYRLEYLGVHVLTQLDAALRKIDIGFLENLALDGNGLDDESQVRMNVEILDISNVQSPDDFPGEEVIGEVEFFERRIEGKNDILLYGLDDGVIDLVVRKAQRENAVG